MPLARNHAHVSSATATTAGAAAEAAGSAPLHGAGSPSATSPLTDEQHRRLNLYLSSSGAGPPLSREASVGDLVAHDGVDMKLLCALDVAPAALIWAKATLADMTRLGYAAEALASSPALCASFVKAFGKPETAVAALRDAASAQVLAGTFAANQLGLTPRMLLGACANERESAMRVIDRLMATAETDAPLAGCCEILARSGIDARTIVAHWGIAPTQLPVVLGAAAQDLAILGCFVDERLPPTPVAPLPTAWGPPAITAPRR